MKRILLSLFITSSVLAAHADEGMWMLTDLQKQNEVAMTELGLLIPANQIYNPDGIALKDAVVPVSYTHLRGPRDTERSRMPSSA